ncbi:alpha/beta hydrolase [Phyllobacterium lublinensis]|uniref:alpha/beta hydrolase n=1 Tax=Phyllobacterium lublinensis TaxID=2875708 RepID=UPI001CC98510|nr:alpha/beta hydrolase [Phyllobacterium sp. 2063]MBZ9655999.1 alpha/beta hydrolase [Phyllobacterium sp. 2063]
MASGVASCASPARGVLSPVTPPPSNTAKVDLLVATTRAPTSERGVFFTGERGSDLSLANVVVSIPPNRRPGTIQWPRRLPGDPERSFVTTAVDTINVGDIRTWYRSHATSGRRVLIFVHGFNTRFEDAVFRFAQIVHDSRAEVTPVLFTWPSRGALLDYNYDRESTNFSRSELGYVIQQAVKSPDVSEITIVAHSMGSWPVMEALRDMAMQDRRISPKITDVVLASPDLDIDVFRKQLIDIGQDRPHISIFVSANDRALRLSRLISGQMTRVGAVDLTNAAYKAQLEEASGITVYDLTALRNGDSLNHAQFATSPEVVRLFGERLLRGQSLSDADPGLPGNFGATAIEAGQTIGTATGVALSAPIRIFEGAVRR